MDLKKFKFPKPSMCLPYNKKLFNEAKRRGFYEGYTPYNKLFNLLYFHGGEINFRQNIDSDFREKAYTYLRAFMTSFEPKHEHKEAICAMLLSELVELNENG